MRCATHLELLSLAQALHVPIILVGRIDGDVLGHHILVQRSLHGELEKGKTGVDQRSDSRPRGPEVKGGKEKPESGAKVYLVCRSLHNHLCSSKVIHVAR